MEYLDVIALPTQTLDAVNQIRQKKAVLAFPYDGKIYITMDSL